VKPKWACTVCGMFSSRRYNVQRHIRSLHNGCGYVILFIEYIIGRQQGYYLPFSVPRYERKLDGLEIFKEEFFREKARMCARIQPK
jgi:hypothetical protein